MLPIAKGIPAINICQPTFTVFAPDVDLYFEKIEPEFIKRDNKALIAFAYFYFIKKEPKKPFFIGEINSAAA